VEELRGKLPYLFVIVIQRRDELIVRDQIVAAVPLDITSKKVQGIASQWRLNLLVADLFSFANPSHVRYLGKWRIAVRRSLLRIAPCQRWATGITDRKEEVHCLYPDAQ
jgi:hypothetical protein